MAVPRNDVTDQEAPRRTVSQSELIALVRDRANIVSGVEALKELSRRRSPQRSRFLIKILLDETQPSDLRSIAAVALGKEDKPPHRQALAKALGSRDPAVVRRSADALGRIGDAKALKALAILRPRVGAAKRSVEFARTLISYRLRLAGNRLKPPRADSVLAVRDERATQLKAKTTNDIKALRSRLARIVPTIPLSAASSLHLLCGNDEFLIIGTSDVFRFGSLASLTEKSAVVAVVLRRKSRRRHYYLLEYLLTHPTRAGRVYLFGVRAGGTVVHFGDVRVGAASTAFTARAIATPYTQPVRIDGVYDHGRQRFVGVRATTNSDVGSRERRLIPTKIEFHVP